MPPADMRFSELETAREFSYKLSEWFSEKPHYRAMAIAHCIEKGLREGYEQEKIMEDPDGKNSVKHNPVNAMRAQWGLPT